MGSISTAATFLRDGLGFAWLPRDAIQTDLEAGLLKPLPLEQGAQRFHPFQLYKTRQHELGPASQILMNLLRKHALPR